MSNQAAIWCKKKEIEALRQAKVKSPIEGYRDYWGGKAAAFADVWEYLVFGYNNGRAPKPQDYNKANEYYSKLVEELENDGRN